MDWGAIIPSLPDGERPVALMAAADELDCPWSDWLRSAAHRLRPAVLRWPEVKCTAWQGTQWVEERWFLIWKSHQEKGLGLRKEVGEHIVYAHMARSNVPDALADLMRSPASGLRFSDERAAWDGLFKAMKRR